MPNLSNAASSDMLRFRLWLGLITLALAWWLPLAGWARLAHGLVVVVAIYSVIPNVRHMVATVTGGGVGIDVLAIIAVAAAVIMHEDIAAMVIVVMMVTGELLEDLAERHAKTELTALLDRAPKLAHVWRGHRAEDTPVDHVRPGDELLIKPGEVVPVDATVTSGASSFDEAAITGESLPVPKQPGDSLLSGAVNTTGLIHAQAVRTSAASQYAQIVAMVQDAGSRRSPLVRLADRYSLPFTLMALTIAGLAWAVSGQPLHALEVLVVATPCPLLIAAPVAIVSGMSRAAGAGIIAKSGAALERLARLRSVAFDKTGTLTLGRPEVAAVRPQRPFRADDVLAAAAALERGSSHVLAAAIVAAAAHRKLPLAPVSQFREDAGLGLRGRVGRQTVVVGRPAYLASAGIPLPENLRSPHIQTSTFVAIDGQYAGAIQFADAIRPETPAVLRQLGRLGLHHRLMLTGDRAATARHVARRLGLTDVRADCLPADKVAALAALPASWRPVAMVGDGVNDAPTLAASDVGIALGAKGSTAASQSADVVIMLDDLGRLPVAIAIARSAVRIAKQSILVGIGLSLILMLVAATGAIPPVVGALLQEAVDVAVIINALRARRAAF
ncbi:MAG TPA: heavy metal translocating P-type ATPase [Candidatus Saccharimonadia bacterium]